MSFFDRLTAETRREREAFLAIPLVKHALVSGASRQLYINFLAEAYHHVNHTFRLLALAAAKTSDERYQDALVEYMVEERGHEKWILDDIRNLGGDADAVRDGPPGLPCQAMVAYAYFAIEHISPYAMLGSVHVLEGMSVLLADRLADALVSSLAISGTEGFSYLRSHGLLDCEHLEFFHQLVDGFDDLATQQIIIDSAAMFYKLYGDIFCELGARVELQHAG